MKQDRTAAEISAEVERLKRPTRNDDDAFGLRVALGKTPFVAPLLPAYVQRPLVDHVCNSVVTPAKVSG